MSQFVNIKEKLIPLVKVSWIPNKVGIGINDYEKQQLQVHEASHQIHGLLSQVDQSHDPVKHAST